jgi:hypothetical protein
MAFFWYKSEGSFSETSQVVLTILLIVFMLWAKFYKTIEHYQRNPRDLLLFPIAVLFSYFHGLIKLYGLCTLSNVRIPLFQVPHMLVERVSWGSRDASKDDSASPFHYQSPELPSRRNSAD